MIGRRLHRRARPDAAAHHVRRRRRRAWKSRSPTAAGLRHRARPRPLRSASSPILHVARDGFGGLALRHRLTVTLSATTGFVVLILGFAFHWQATRAREADVIYDTVRSRIDTALNRGRCGLWDWDLARGRIFWSHSMFAILGLEPRDELLTLRRGQRAGASRRHQALRACRPSSPTPDQRHRPRLPHAPRRRPLGLAARALRAGAASRRRRACI